MMRFLNRRNHLNLLVYLTPLFLLSPIYLTGKVLFWGTPLLQFGPWWSQAWQSILAGQLPLWNPFVGMGAPLLANYQSALLYPPTWIYFGLYLLGGDSLIAWGMAPLAALHLVWACFGMVLLTRRLGLGVLAQAISGLAFGLSGYLVTRLGFLSINAASAWIPWILIWLTPLQNQSERYDSQPYPRRQNFSKLALCLTAMLLAGHAQTAWYALIFGALWGGFWAWNKSIHGNLPTGHTRTRDVFLTWLFFGLAILLASGIAAIQLFPTAEYLLQSQRAAAVDFEYALNYSFWPWHLITLIAPGFFGSPVSGDYWGYGNFWEDAVYVGLLPFLLAVSAIVSSLKSRTRADRNQRLVWFLVVIFIISFIFGTGKNTPLYPWLYRNVPTFNMFQAPARWLIWAEVVLALLAALGAERWRRPMGWGLYWTRLGTMAAIAVSLGSGLTWIFLGTVSPTFIRASAVLGILGAAAGALSLSAPVNEYELSTRFSIQGKPQESMPRPKSRFFHLSPPPIDKNSSRKPYNLVLWQWGVIAFIAIDLLYAWWGMNPGEDPKLYGSAPTASEVREISKGGRIFIPPEDEEWLKYSRFLRFDTFNPGEDWENLRAVMLANMNILDRIPSANNFDPLVPGHYADWMQMLEIAQPEVREQMLDLMDVGAILDRSSNDPFGVVFDDFDGDYMRWIECAKRAANSVEARELVLEGKLDFDRIAVIEGFEPLPSEECSSDLKASSRVPDLTEYHPDTSLPGRLVLNIYPTDAGWLVISDTWYPGWHARVDGKPEKIYRANFLFRAIHLPAGEHEIILDYKPISFYVGTGLTFTSLVILIIIGRRINKRKPV